MIFIVLYLLGFSRSYGFESGILDFVIIVVGFAFIQEIPFLANIIMAIVLLGALITLIYGYLEHYPLQ